MTSQVRLLKRSKMFILLLIFCIVLSTPFAITTNTAQAAANLAAGKPVSASSYVDIYKAANVNDGDPSTYWESSSNAFPQWLRVDLGSVKSVNQLVLRLPSSWEQRTQTLSVLTSTDDINYTNSVASTGYSFDPSKGNTVTINFPNTDARYVKLNFTANSGWPAGQLSEFEVYGSDPALPQPPSGTYEAESAQLSGGAKVNTDHAGFSGAGFVDGYLVPGAKTQFTVNVSAAGSYKATLKYANAAGGSRTVSLYVNGTKIKQTTLANLPNWDTWSIKSEVVHLNAGSNTIAYKFDPTDTGNVNLDQLQIANAGTTTRSAFSPIEAESYDNQSGIQTEPSSEGGLDVGFIDHGDYVVYNNIDFGSGASTFEARVASETSGGNIEVRLDSLTGTLAGTCAVTGTGGWQNWTTKTCSINPVSGLHHVYLKFTGGSNMLNLNWFKFSNASSASTGASMPYDMYEAEDGVIGGGAAIVGPNRNIGDLAGEASGRRAVTLNSTGSYVQFTTKASTNTLVARFSIPDAPGGDGLNNTLNVYVNGKFAKAINLTSKYAWLYGEETSPVNSPGAGAPRHIYDEANIMFDNTIPAGSTIKLQKDPGNTTTYAIDFINLEQVSPMANPDPAKYVTPTGTTQQAVQHALDQVRMDQTGQLVGVYLPAGTYETGAKFQVFGKPVKVIGAGPWYTKFVAPSNLTNTDIGFAVNSSANGSTFANFAYFGNYTNRVDGPGKVFEFTNVANMTVDNVWVEHEVVMFWGQNADNNVIQNSRIRDIFADGINFTNGSTNNHVTNIEARSTGDDSFALFNAVDAGTSEDNRGNVFENLTSLLPWRAAGLAVYGGYDNTFRNIYIADTLVFSGATVSSLDFGIPFRGFGSSPQTVIQNISLVRTGGHFFGDQTFPALWLFSASKEFRGIRISDVNIEDPTYHGIMFQTNYNGSTPEHPITDTVLSNITISGVHKSGDAFDAKSGFGLWANGSVGDVTINNLKFLNMGQSTIPTKNDTSTFTIKVNP
ncbi:hypothetical protein FHS19_006010 [Paenibacillus rhizosphaerae]|uniref:Glycosyl hydrolase n=1 Tax=Paenibacillus rhizosphaerae TaxID=297318 RepID=A0A839U0K3_9BACL|nr:carbohydrate-binding protein [Paenibacillus rhizosphaerae]MBB3131290.1 hypothetical protein [Paenibacillus rhizosphaerae]